MNTPPKLYKFQSCSNYAFDNLQQRCIWFSKPETFNDPFDCDINFRIVDDTDENVKSLANRMKISFHDGKPFTKDEAVRMAQSATEMMKKKQWEAIRVACFTEKHDNILMWSHYANNHQGFCLEFDTNFYPFKPFKNQTVLKVNYSDSYPSLSIKDIPNNLPSMPRNLLGTKSLHWSYENEWRIFSSEDKYVYDKFALTGVYFGCKMKNEDKHKIVSILAGLPTILYQMQRSVSEFVVSAKEFSGVQCDFLPSARARTLRPNHRPLRKATGANARVHVAGRDAVQGVEYSCRRVCER